MSNFTTSKGRVIRLVGLKVVATYEGWLEGSRESISQIIIERLSSVNSRLGPGEIPMLVLPIDILPLPSFRWTVELSSPRGVKNTDPDYDSMLKVTWFADAKLFDLTVHEIVESKLAIVDWEQYAADIDITIM